MGIYIKSNIDVRKTPTSRTMNLKLCKFPRVQLARFRLVQRQSATCHSSHMRTIVTQSLKNPLQIMTVYKARQGPSVNNEVELKELKALLKNYSCHHFAGKTK